jgi:uncharacterized protein YabE (DUF348 family)
VNGTVRKSPARAEPAEPEAWLPIPDVDTLPALEELLDDDQLVPSGQTQAITDTQPTPVVPPAERWAAFRARVPQREHAPRRRRSRRIDLRKGRKPAAKPAKPAPAPKPALKQRTPQARPRPRRHRRRRLVIVGLALLTAGAVAFAVPKLLPHAPAMTIRVDGKQRISAETEAETVRVALRDHHVKLAPEDRVAPGPTAKVTDGLTVNVFRAFPVVVDIDGDVQPINTTWPKPAQLVRQLHLDPKKTSIVTAPTRLTQGSSVVLRTLHEVTISVDGTQNAESTAALNIGEFLQQNGVVLGPEDQISPPADTRVADGMTVAVARVIKDTAQADEALLPPTIRQDDPGLPKGQEKEIQAGVPGVQRITYEITKKDGQDTARAPISKVPIQPPTPRIIAVGTALPNSRSGSASWYASPFGSDSCATKENIAKGVILRVTNLNTGQSTTCRVADRVEANRVVDLDDDVFARLAPKDSGAFPARIDW